MGMDLAKYDYLLFDCDGVILDSNDIKADAFYKVALTYGEACANELLAYHRINGGVSRIPKFEYFLSKIVPRYHQEIDGSIDALLERFSSFVREGLVRCAASEALPALKEQCKPGAQWAVVSGGDQDELRRVLFKRGLDSYFEKGIYGSPDDKDTILKEKLKLPPSASVLFLGDSRYDFQVASRSEFDFVFLHGWTGMPDWECFCKENNILYFETLSDLVVGI